MFDATVFRWYIDTTILHTFPVKAFDILEDDRPWTDTQNLDVPFGLKSGNIKSGKGILPTSKCLGVGEQAGHLNEDRIKEIGGLMRIL